MKEAKRGEQMAAGDRDGEELRHGHLGKTARSVVRVAADVQRESRLGAILTYGNPAADNADNGVAGVDYRYRNSNFAGSQVLVADAFFCAEVCKKRTACSDHQNDNPMAL